ncbi:hypothetical protein ILYODFUR_032280, partial [Ilyodon furcidens]
MGASNSLSYLKTKPSLSHCTIMKTPKNPCTENSPHSLIPWPLPEPLNGVRTPGEPGKHLSKHSREDTEKT